jgi:hypothetical protein
VSGFAIWRIEALAAPRWMQACSGCHAISPFESNECFRVNANGGRLDVWLLYGCRGCGATAKRSVLRRVRVADVDPARLDGYHRNDAALAWRHAFDVATAEPLPHRVVRPPLPASGVLHVAIEQPFACGLRCDALLAAELGWSRTRVARAFAAKQIELLRGASLASRVRDGDAIRVAMP